MLPCDVRTFAAEMRADDEGVVEGYAALFNVMERGERIAPGAFSKSLAAGDDIKALWNHDTSVILGRTKNNTLSIVEDGLGLRVRFTPPDTQAARDAHTLIKGGFVSQMSFGFRIRENGARVDKEGDQRVRTLLDLELHEVSPVTFPWYTATSVIARDEFEEQYNAYAELNNRLRLAEIEI